MDIRLIVLTLCLRPFTTPEEILTTATMNHHARGGSLRTEPFEPLISVQYELIEMLRDEDKNSTVSNRMGTGIALGFISSTVIECELVGGIARPGARTILQFVPPSTSNIPSLPPTTPVSSIEMRKRSNYRKVLNGQ